MGLGNIDGTGNELNNRLTGNSAANTLNGLGGRDTYTGGIGADTFVFGPALLGQADTVTDFLAGVDHVAVNGTDFGLAAGALDPSGFEVSTAAGLGHAEFFFDSAGNTLYWDDDGIAGASIAVAVFSNGAVLSAADFVIV